MTFHKAIELLRKHSVPARKLFFYVLIKDDIEDALGRIPGVESVGLPAFRTAVPRFRTRGKTFAGAVAAGLLV